MPDAMKKHDHFRLWAYGGGIGFLIAAILLLAMLLRTWATLIDR
jgi:hypothetical protein